MGLINFYKKNLYEGEKLKDLTFPENNFTQEVLDLI